MVSEYDLGQMLRVRCPSCSVELPEEARFCFSCGSPISSVSQMATGLSPPSDQPRTPSSLVGRLVYAESIDLGGFAPGAVLVDRYRIVGLVGRGGMGEVYRADDIKLGQVVALKFLPKALSEDPGRRDRFFSEVRLARQVAHPNVCRMYDVGELEGRHFLSMEYVDGEDLGSLLRRIGRLPPDKALEVARQLCAGLAAAHEKGVVHRDLKPSNVMLDGRGRARITDFGLAVAAGESDSEGEVAGTPAYMAPEQFAGAGATERSDLYALGLVLYELFTGRSAFVAATLRDLVRLRREGNVIAPGEIVREIDPTVEATILRCLAVRPQDRPESALAVLTALTGGDPLKAALAAGQTPSPSEVAAAPVRGALAPAAAWACLGVVLATLVAAYGGLSARVSVLERVAPRLPPSALAVKAEEAMRALGHGGACTDDASGFAYDDGALRAAATASEDPPAAPRPLPQSGA